MGSLFSKRCPWRRCRLCERNVKIFEPLCCFCAAATRRMEAPARYTGKPQFGEYLCVACEIIWTSRLCWPCHYQACKHCQQLAYPYTWRDLTAAEIKREAKTKDHQRHYCQKCLEYTRNLSYHALAGCSCSGDKQDSSVDSIKYDDDGTMGSVNTIQPFPSTDQIWGMVGTILAIGAVWMLFSTMKRRKAPAHPPVLQTQQRGGDKQRQAAAPLAQNSQRDTQTSNPRCK